MKKVFFLFLLSPFLLTAQKYKPTELVISFFSEAPLENIEAVNKKAQALYDEATQAIAFSIPIHEFEFKDGLMKEHFEEKYMETEKFPKATFSGVLQKGENQTAWAKGKLTIHGVTKEVEIKGSFIQANGALIIEAKFTVKPADYNITIPKLLWQKVAEEIAVSLHGVFKK